MQVEGNDLPLMIPAPARAGEPIRARDTNAERTALRVLDKELRRRTVRGSLEIGAERGPGGTRLFLRRKALQKAPVCGLMPVARNGDSPGVGLVDGKVLLVRTAKGTAAGGEETEEVTIELGGTALDSTPAPRETLAAGDWDAWVIFQEVEGDHRARVEFETLGAGPPSLRRDEKAVRVSSFTVSLPEETANIHGESIAQVPTVEVLEQYVCDVVPMFIEGHHFRAIKTADAKVKVAAGVVMWPEGLSDPLVMQCWETAESSEFTITEAGSIWLKLGCSVAQHSTTAAEVSSGVYVRLRTYRISALSSTTFEFKATGAEPTPGSDATTVWTAGGDLYVKLFEVALEDSEVQVTQVCVQGEIYAPAWDDASVEIETVP